MQTPSSRFGSNRARAAAALMLVCFATGFVGGYLTHRAGWLSQLREPITRWLNPPPEQTADPMPVGRWAKIEPDSPELTTEQELAALGYVAGVEPPPSDTGVVRHDADGVFAGLNFYTSGHGPEALLIDMDGNVLHRWRVTFAEAWPGREPGFGQPDYWRRALLLENGDVITIFDNLGLVRVDANSRVVWRLEVNGHHDLFAMDDGRFFVLTHYVTRDPEINEGREILEDFISIISADGEELERISINECLRNSPYRATLQRVPDTLDIFHTNTIQVFGGNLDTPSAPFEPGQVLVSMRNIDSIAVLDLERRTTVWMMAGMWRAQHEPSLLADGEMLIFDNLARDEASRVLQFDPLSQQVSWSFEGSGPRPFFSRYMGTAYRLPNGNTLITQSESGRVLEVTPTGDIAWEFLNPSRAGDNDEFIAVIFDLYRVPREFTRSWLKPAGA